MSSRLHLQGMTVSQQPPKSLKAHRAEGVLEIGWPTGDSFRLPFRYLRGRCPCASCVDEFTGRRVVGVDEVPEGIEIVAAELQGNYALKITWNDRHNTGLYTWENLRSLCDGGEWLDRQWP